MRTFIVHVSVNLLVKRRITWLTDSNFDDLQHLDILCFVKDDCTLNATVHWSAHATSLYLNVLEKKARGQSACSPLPWAGNSIKSCPECTSFVSWATSVRARVVTCLTRSAFTDPPTRARNEHSIWSESLMRHRYQPTGWLRQWVSGWQLVTAPVNSRQGVLSITTLLPLTHPTPTCILWVVKHRRLQQIPLRGTKVWVYKCCC